jgi:hypothetical protein
VQFRGVFLETNTTYVAADVAECTEILEVDQLQKHHLFVKCGYPPPTGYKLALRIILISLYVLENWYFRMKGSRRRLILHTIYGPMRPLNATTKPMIDRIHLLVICIFTTKIWASMIHIEEIFIA